MNKIAFSLIAAFSLVSCNASGDEAPPLAGARMGGALTLQNQNGQRVSDTDFAGQYRIIYFGYTYCPDVCPTDVQILSKGLAAFEKRDPARAAKVQPIFISADPKRDTPQVLREFLANFHPRFIGLTGTEAQIDALSGLFAVSIEREKPGAGGAYLVNHSNLATLYSPKGEPIAFLNQDKGAEAVAESLAQWVK